MTKEYCEYFPSDGAYSTKEYIDQIFSPKIAHEFHMQYVGNYKWCGVWENGTRPILQLFLLRGDCAIFEWGYHYHFLPILKNGKLTYQRTDKSAQTQLRDLPDPFIDIKDWHPFSIPMHAKYEDKLIGRLEEVWNKTFPFIKDWYAKTATIEDMIREADRQLRYQKYYSYFFPSQQYIKAFLLAATGQATEATATLTASDIYGEADEKNRQKLMEKLSELLDNHL